MLVNNGFKNSDIDSEIKMKFERYKKENINKAVKTKIKLYYRNYMTDAYKVDERILKEIINKTVKPKGEEKVVDIVIYYKNRKIKDLIMKNNCSPQLRDLQESNVNYEFVCKSGNCEAHNVSYVGKMQTILSRRLTMHLQSLDSAIVDHYITEHDRRPMRSEVVGNTKIIGIYKDRIRLDISEALYIKRKAPILNRQDKGMTRVLKLF